MLPGAHSHFPHYYLGIFNPVLCHRSDMLDDPVEFVVGLVSVALVVMLEQRTK
jgi:hypothetical protein